VRHRILGGIAAAALVAGLLAAPASASLSRPYRVDIDASGLEPLDGAFYEVWVVSGERKISAGSFNVDAEGNLVDGFGHEARFSSQRDPATADAIVVTIEPLPDADPGPSGIIVLAGAPKAKKGTAKLKFPVKFADASGSFILATPTDAVANDETAGIWFLDPATGPGPSLTLPTLPSGWVYEGWGVTQGTPLSTGRFMTAAGADDSSAFSGPLAGPPFPGEDFLANLPAGVTGPVNLADGSSMAVLTVEPYLDGSDPTGSGPFSIKPFITVIPAGQADHTSVALSLDTSTVPSGTASF
jgi:hypothetical protein